MAPTFTVSQISRWHTVTGTENDIDCVSKCPVCVPHSAHNRIRFDARKNELERVTCSHFLRYEYRQAEGVIYFVFGIGR